MQAHDFCGIVFMFLTPPTLEELKQSDLPDLVDMLSKQSIEYSQLSKAGRSYLQKPCNKRIDP